MNFSLKKQMLLAAALGLLCFWTDLAAAAPAKRFNLQSADYPVIVVCSDPEYGGLVLDVLNRSYKYFADTTGIRSFGALRFRFLLEDARPMEVSREMESLSYPRQLKLDGEIDFKIDLPSRDFNPVALVRTAMICQLEAFALKDRDWKTKEIPADPFWLVEGLTQGFLDKKTPNLEKIIARIDRAGPVPTLEMVQGWTGISPHRLEQFWQEACCYWLVKQATLTQADRDTLQSWLILWYGENSRAYWDKNPETEVWWKKTLGERTADKAGYKGEEQTREELQRCLQFKARLKGQDISQEFSLAKLPPPPLEFASAKPFEEVMNRLVLLQVRGNFLWQDVIESYRMAYTYWLKGKYADYQREIAAAESKAQNVSTYMEKTREYLNWFEVNHPVQGPKFSTLLQEALAFQDAEALERQEQTGLAARLTRVENKK